MTDTTDQVKRLLQFSTRHPGWQVISPRDTRSVLRGELDWRATGPGNQFIRERELSDLIDEMEQAAALADGLGHDAELARLRAQHTNWDYIGKRAGEIGWWASQETRPGITHHITALTLPELSQELSAARGGERDV